MHFLAKIHLRNSLQFSNVRDGETKKEVHEDEGHDHDEDEEEDLGDEGGVVRIGEVCCEVEFSHKHCQHLKCMITCLIWSDLIVCSL